MGWSSVREARTLPSMGGGTNIQKAQSLGGQITPALYVNNMLREYDNMKEAIKNRKTTNEND